MNVPFVVFDRGPGQKRAMVTPDAFFDAIEDPVSVCRHIAFLAALNNVDATAGIVTESGAAKLLGDAA